jgi:CheY-like chemotaxis protein
MRAQPSVLPFNFGAMTIPVLAVVDDDEIFQVIARKMMAICAPQWKIQTFPNGQEALKYLKQYATDPDKIPDVVLLDINMPVMDGWMFLDEFQRVKSQLTKTMKIYLASSSIDSQDIDRGKSNPNLVDYIIKPLTVETIGKITAA